MFKFREYAWFCKSHKLSLTVYRYYEDLRRFKADPCSKCDYEHRREWVLWKRRTPKEVRRSTKLKEKKWF